MKTEMNGKETKAAKEAKAAPSVYVVSYSYGNGKTKIESIFRHLSHAEQYAYVLQGRVSRDGGQVEITQKYLYSQPVEWE